MNRFFIFNFIAAVAIPAHRAVKASGPKDGEADYCATLANGDGVVIGVSPITDTKEGEHFPVTIEGIAPIIAGEDLSADDCVKADKDGKAVKGEAGDLCFGVCAFPAVSGGKALVLLKSITLPEEKK